MDDIMTDDLNALLQRIAEDVSLGRGGLESHPFPTQGVPEINRELVRDDSTVRCLRRNTPHSDRFLADHADVRRLHFAGLGIKQSSIRQPVVVPIGKRLEAPFAAPTPALSLHKYLPVPVETLYKKRVAVIIRLCANLPQTCSLP